MRDGGTPRARGDRTQSSIPALVISLPCYAGHRGRIASESQRRAGTRVPACPPPGTHGRRHPPPPQRYERLKEKFQGRSDELRKLFEGVLKPFKPDGPGGADLGELADALLLRRGDRRADALYHRLRVRAASHLLQSRARTDWLRRHGIPPPPPALNAQQRLEIKECFQLLDEDGSGGLDAEELYEAFHELGFRPNRGEIAAMLKEMDTKGAGVLGFHQFMDIMSRQLSMSDRDAGGGGRGGGGGGGRGSRSTCCPRG